MKRWIYKRPRYHIPRPRMVTGVAVPGTVGHAYLAAMIRIRSHQPLIRM